MNSGERSSAASGTGTGTRRFIELLLNIHMGSLARVPGVLRSISLPKLLAGGRDVF
jgi:hypothetical protein